MLKYYNQKLKGVKGVLPDIRGFSRTSDDGQLQSVVGIDNLLIYGNSIQDGTPSPDNPVEIQSVGDFDVQSGKYKIPITAGEKTTNIYLDEPLRKIGDYADYIDWKNKTVVRNVGTWTVTGSSYKNSGLYREYATCWGHYLYSPFGDVWVARMQMCNALTKHGSVGYDLEGFCAGDNSGRIYIKILKSRVPNATDSATARSAIAQYMDDNNLEFRFIYQRIEPINEKIDLPDLKSIIPQYDRSYTLSVGTTVTPQLSIKYRSNYQEEV